MSSKFLMTSMHATALCSDNQLHILCIIQSFSNYWLTTCSDAVVTVSLLLKKPTNCGVRNGFSFLCT